MGQVVKKDYLSVKTDKYRSICPTIKMAKYLGQLPDQFKQLDWNSTDYVRCLKYATCNPKQINCSLCEVQISLYFQNEVHVIIGWLQSPTGGPQIDTWRSDDQMEQVHYICNDCHQKCPICH